MALKLNSSSVFIPVNRKVRNLIKRALKEDLGTRGDITTFATIPINSISRAIIKAKADGVIAGVKVAEAVFSELDPQLKFSILKSDGQRVRADEIVVEIWGLTRAILVGERTALNFLMRASGIATLTRRLVEATQGTGVKISETRKTAPGLRHLDKWAVRVGGGHNHRWGLYDAFLIKENHINASGGITPAIAQCLQYRDEKGLSRCMIMVEARNREEFLQAQEAGAERILLDNMTPSQVQECVRLRKPGVLIEASGGINETNILEYAHTGVDVISLGALTHSPHSLDLSLLIVQTEATRNPGRLKKVSPLILEPR